MSAAPPLEPQRRAPCSGLMYRATKFVLFAVVSVAIVFAIITLADRRQRLPGEATQSTPSPAQMISPGGSPQPLPEE